MDLSSLSDDELRQLSAKQALAQRGVQSMSDDELRAAAYKQPAPPPGVTMHTANGDVYSPGNGKLVPASPAETAARFDREKNGTGGDFADSVVRGIPYAGAFLPRARAAVSDGDYSTNLINELARAKTYDADSPVPSLAGKALGAIGGTVASLPVMASGGAAGLMARLLMGGGGGTAVGSMARGSLAGLLQGAAQGAGGTQDLTNAPDAAKDIGKDAGFGAVFGAAVPGLINAGVAAKNYVGNYAGDVLSSIPKAAQKYAEGMFGDPAKLANMRQDMANLGPEAMLADVSPDMKAMARGAAARPGTRDMIVNALNERDAGKNARLGSVVGSEFGPDAVPSQVMSSIKAEQTKLGPLYDQAFNGATAVDTQSVAHNLEALAVQKRGDAQAAAKSVREMLNLSGTDQLDRDPRTLHQVRMAIDGMMDNATDGNVKATLKQARTAIDNELAAKVPGIKPIDSAYADLQRQKDAFKSGQEAFDSGRSNVLRPSELKDLQTQLVQPAGTAAGPPTRGGIDRLSEGARSEIERLVGTNANDVAKLNQLLKGEGDWNRQKLRLLFGGDKADKVLKVLDGERVMEETHRFVTGGSATEPTKRFADFIDNVAKPSELHGEPTLFGTGVKALKWGFSKVTGDRAQQNADKMVEALANIPIAKQQNADALIQALMARSQRNQATRSVYNLSGVGASADPLVSALIARRYGGQSNTQP